MAGIRVRNVPKNKTEKHLKIYFSKPEHGGGRIKKIYFPLFNNDAVILFEDKKVVDKVLKGEHCIGSHRVEVQELPEHMVFSTMDAKLDSEASIIVQVTPTLRDEMQYSEGIKLTEEKDQTYRLQGNWFQLEWAWHYIDCFMQQQEVIQHEISQQPQRYAGQPMEVEQSDTQEDFRTTSTFRNSPTSPTEVNTALRRNIAERSKMEDSLGGVRQKKRELQSDRSAHREDDIVESLSIREHGKEGQFYGYRKPKSHIDDDDDDDGDVISPSQINHDNMGALKSNITSSYDDDYNHRNYTSKSSLQDSDEELSGSGHNIPLDSMQSMINPAEASRRSEDENSTFRDFSGLHSLSQYSPDKSFGRSSKNENSRRDSAHRESNTSVESHSSLSSSQGRNLSVSPSRKEGLGRSGKPSVDAVDHSLGLSKPRLPARSKDIPDRYTEDQLCHSFDIRGVKVTIYYGDLVKEETDAIVNAANEQLEHYGGIAYVLLKARGRAMDEECRQYIRKNGKLKTSDVAHTSGGGEIKASHIIHAAGPMWLSERWKDKFTYQLTQTFLNCLEYADKTLWIKSIALPAISSGVYGAPLDLCVRCFLDAILIFTHQRDDQRLADIRLVNNDAESTVTSIVLVQTLLDHGIETLTADTEEFMAKYGNDDREMNLPRGRPEGITNFSKTYNIKDTSLKFGHSSIDSSLSGDKWLTPSRRRSSSLSRVADKKAQSGEVRRYDVQKGEFVTECKTKQPTTAGSSVTEKHRERSGSVNMRQKKGMDPSLRNTITGATGVTESLGLSTKQPFSTESTRKSAPKIKSALLTSDKIKSFKSSASSPKRSEHFGQRTSDDYGAFKHGRKSKPSYRLHSDTSGDDEDFGLQSLPVDLHKHSYREKFLQNSAGKPEVCAICLDDVKDPKQLAKCNHKFCRACIERHFRSSKPTCPTCGALYGKVIGDQPRGGRMTHATDRSRCLPGYEREDGMIVITYTFPDGMQESCHPQPGRSYKGITRKAFLPNCVEGREVLRLLKKAFDARLVFTIGDSKTSGDRGVLTWNDIHHKTSIGGGPTRYGYPDSGYLQRVKDELAIKGVTNDK